MPDPILTPRSAFAGLAPQAAGPGVRATDRDGLGLAVVLARKGQSAALAARVTERFGLDLPQGPRRAAHGDIAFIGTGPDAWLVTREAAGNALAPALEAELLGLASVIDQTDGYAVLRLTGPKLRATLAKGVTLDLDPRVFRVGDAAVTVVSHIGVTLWRLDDAPDGAPVFEATVFRSLARDFWHWLSDSSGEFGLTLD